MVEENESVRQLLERGLTRGEIRRRLVSQRKGLPQAEAEKESAKQFQLQASRFQTIEQYQRAYSRLPAGVRRRVASFEEIKKQQQARISKTQSLLEEAKASRERQISTLRAREREAAREGKTDRQERLQDAIAEKEKFWTSYESGLRQGQQQLKEGKIISVDKIRGFATSSGDLAAEKSRTSAERLESIKAAGFSSVTEYARAKGVLSKIEAGTATRADIRKLPSEVRQRLDLGAGTTTTTTGRTFENVFTGQKVSSIESPGALWVETTPGRTALMSAIESRRMSIAPKPEQSFTDRTIDTFKDFLGDKPLFEQPTQDFSQTTRSTAIGFTPEDIMISGGGADTSVLDFITPGVTERQQRGREIKESLSDLDEKAKKAKESLERLEEFSEGKFDPRTNVWTGTEAEFRQYELLKKQYEKDLGVYRKEQKEFRSLGGTFTSEGVAQAPTVRVGFGALSERVPITEFVAGQEDDLIGQISAVTKAGLITSMTLFGESGAVLAGDFAAGRRFVGEELFGLEEGEELFTIPGVDGVVPIAGERSRGTAIETPGERLDLFKEIKTEPIKVLEITKEKEQSIIDLGRAGGRIAGAAAPFVAASYVGGAIGASVAGAAIGSSLGAFAGETALFAALRGSEFRDIVVEEGGLKRGAIRFTKERPLEVAGLGLSAGGAIGSAAIRSVKFARTAKFLEQSDLGKTFKFLTPLKDTILKEARYVPSFKVVLKDDPFFLIAGRAKRKGLTEFVESFSTGRLVGESFELRKAGQSFTLDILTGDFGLEDQFKIIRGQLEVSPRGSFFERVTFDEGVIRETFLDPTGKGTVKLFKESGEEILERQIKSAKIPKFDDFTETAAKTSVDISTPGAGTRRLALVEQIDDISRETTKVLTREGDELVTPLGQPARTPRQARRMTSEVNIKKITSVDEQLGARLVRTDVEGFEDVVRVGEKGRIDVFGLDDEFVTARQRVLPKIEFGEDIDFAGEALTKRAGRTRKAKITASKVDRRIQQFAGSDIVISFGRKNLPDVAEVKFFKQLTEEATQQRAAGITDVLKSIKKRSDEIGSAVIGGVRRRGGQALKQIDKLKIGELGEKVFVQPAKGLLREARRIKTPSVPTSIQLAKESERLITGVTGLGVRVRTTARTRQQPSLRESTRLRLESETKNFVRQASRLRSLQKQSQRLTQQEKLLTTSQVVPGVKFTKVNVKTPRISTPRLGKIRFDEKFFLPIPKSIKGRVTTKKERKRPTREPLVLTRGFTARALGLKPLELTREEAIREALKPSRAIGIRRGAIIINGKGNKKRKKKKRTNRKNTINIGGIQETLI